MSSVNPDPFEIGRAPALWRPAAFTRLALAALSGLPAVFGLAAMLAGPQALPVTLALGGYAAGAIMALRLMQRGYPHPTLGLCNLATLARLGLTASLLAPLAAGGSASWGVAAVATLAMALDGVDGWLARREARVSEFGARFDMEVDSALALILALGAWAAGTTGAIVLILGLPRYLFMVAGLILPWLNRPLPERFSRKAVCVLQLGTLIALQLPPVAGPVADTAVLAVAAALLWSFATDIAWLRRARA